MMQRVHNWQRRCCNRYPLSRLYFENHMQVHRPDGQFHFFEQQTAESRQPLEDAQSATLGISSRVELVLYAVHHSDPRQRQGLAGMSRSIPRKCPNASCFQRRKFENLCHRLYKSEDGVSCPMCRPIPALVPAFARQRSWPPACCSSPSRWL